MSEGNSKIVSPTCPICKNDFDVYYRMPRVIPKCGHTFCEKCISNKLSVKSNRKVFICPQCSSEVIIRKGVQQDVPKNIGIIDIVKNMKKYTNNQRQQQRKQVGQLCTQHLRPLQLTCQSCSFKKICSHCVLFGQHHSHTYHKDAPATNTNLKQLKEVYDLLQNSVKLVLLPNSECNIKRTIKQKISEGLKKSIKSNFRQYYDMLQKKQQQILQQCNNILISEGGIDNNIDKLVYQYDTIKSKYQIQWSFSIQHTNFAKHNKLLTINNIQQFIAKCQSLHNKVISIQDQAIQHIDGILKDIGIRVSQSLIFKIQQMPFSLKKIVEELTKPDSKQVVSPQRKARLKSATSDIKSKSLIQKEEMKTSNIQFAQKNDRNSNKSQNKAMAPKQAKNTYSQIDKYQSLQDDFSLLESGKSEIRTFKQNTQNKQLKELGPNKYVSNGGERGSLPPKATKSKISDYDSKTMNIRQFKEQEKPKGPVKDLSPARTINVISKTNNPPVNSLQTLSSQDIKFVRPTKQISFQLLSKFQQIMVQTDRQLEMSTLQLVGLDINDALLLYLLDYLRVKRYKFQVIKLVKNLITDQGFKTILGYLINDNTTQLLNMTSNHLTAKCLDMIVIFGEKNSTLKTIYLGGNKINAVNLRSKKNELSRYEIEIVI